MTNSWGGRRVESELIAKHHYEWCKNNGHDTSWYKKKVRGLRPMTIETSRQSKLSMRTYKGCK